MTITLQTLKEFFSTSTPWEIDFRDMSIETKAMLYSVRKVGGLVFSVLTIILSVWVGINFVKGRSLEGTLKMVQDYVSVNETKNVNLLKLNKSFYEERDRIAALVNALSDCVDIREFLKDLVKIKSEKIKFGEIIVQKDKKDPKQKNINLTVRLNGWAKDIDLVETLKNDILNCPSLSQKPNCKSFFQLDPDANGFQEEVKFQITLQSNE